jgi:surface antigen
MARAHHRPAPRLVAGQWNYGWSVSTPLVSAASSASIVRTCAGRHGTLGRTPSGRGSSDGRITGRAVEEADEQFPDVAIGPGSCRVSDRYRTRTHDLFRILPRPMRKAGKMLFLRRKRRSSALIVFAVVGIVAGSGGSRLAYANPVSHELQPAGVQIATGYAYGECTYWVSNRRAQVGKPIPQNWGNANSWANAARAAGYTVNHTPQVTAIMQTSAGSTGHVAFVEAVYSDGSWQVSEMNYTAWNVVDYRTLPASASSSYNFIH